MLGSPFIEILPVIASLIGLFSITAIHSKGKTGALVVDIQGDFTTFKDGSLAAEGTDEAYINRVQQETEKLKKKGYPVFASQDWHPADHMSFHTNHEGKEAFETMEINDRRQILWPPHCVQGTENAEILLDEGLFEAIVQKGKDSRFDSYSAFKDDGGAKTELDEILKAYDIENLIIFGIATDYCVKATSIDLIQAGYKVTVIQDLCRGVTPDTTAKALEEMKEKGVNIKKSLDV